MHENSLFDFVGRHHLLFDEPYLFSLITEEEPDLLDCIVRSLQKKSSERSDEDIRTAYKKWNADK